MTDFIPGLGTEARNEEYAPKAAKGGVFAPADIDLIKRLIMAHVSDSSLSLTPPEEQQAINLLHRLNRIG
jgi:hypothetical protein